MAKKTETRAGTAHINPFGLRLQPGLRQLLEQAATDSGRSLNAEIAQRLEDSFHTQSLREVFANTHDADLGDLIRMQESALSRYMGEISIISSMIRTKFNILDTRSDDPTVFDPDPRSYSKHPPSDTEDP